ncbi:snoRNP assembly factor Naf1 [Schizosaccharomyces cryophilus OY26]|uniref:H/ACA ribonucleoprotein complex non-core subunit NAF1 n=1 Tax=Schizosaccharomyces cryophilus (strain OY26 / ATCC MYA-4695 / CBS 11777 / NBRC 106824 / NRRL Y48691) TaxID=653667 RepID=S9XJU3_SCHCR|nr:snoRNP assembly factor Naf1 [Schizosaccharomyces cryophilus OY26]EPY53976.1 snoRNP assembly factor Naf1 [Schizosaccharomyces cryophilus OY26]
MDQEQPCKIPGLSLIYNEESPKQESVSEAPSINENLQNQRNSSPEENNGLPKEDGSVKLNSNELGITHESSSPEITVKDVSTQQKFDGDSVSKVEESENRTTEQSVPSMDVLDLALANPASSVVPSTTKPVYVDNSLSTVEPSTIPTQPSEGKAVQQTESEETPKSVASDSSSDSDSDSSLESSSESESDSDSDSTSSLSEVEEPEKVEVEHESEATPPKTIHELPEEVYERPTIELGPDSPIEPLGQVLQVLKKEIVIQSDVQNEELIFDEKTVLCFEDKTIVGYIHETFGPVSSPFYVVRFTNEDECASINPSVGKKVFYVPTMANRLDPEPLKYIKGSDASNVYDEEINPSEQEFSDDEAEAAAKQSKRKKKRKTKSTSQPSMVEAEVSRSPIPRATSVYASQTSVPSPVSSLPPRMPHTASAPYNFYPVHPGYMMPPPPVPLSNYGLPMPDAASFPQPREYARSSMAPQFQAPQMGNSAVPPSNFPMSPYPATSQPGQIKPMPFPRRDWG